MAKRKATKARKRLYSQLQWVNSLLKNRTPIIAITSMLSMLVQLGCDPLGLFPPTAQKAIQQASHDLQQLNLQNSGVPGFNPGSTAGQPTQWPQQLQTAAGQAYQAYQQIQGSWGKPISGGAPAANAGSPHAPLAQSQQAQQPQAQQPQVQQSQLQQPQFQQAGYTAQPVNSYSLVPFDNRALLIGSFNIQVFGSSKLAKPEVAKLLVEIVRRFDLVAIQELRATDQGVMDQFLQMINQSGGTYRYVVGERLGTTSSKEQYTYVYDAAKLRVTHQPTTVHDAQGVMMRPPLATRFQCVELPDGQGFTFTLLNVHTTPDQADRDLQAIESVVAAARQLLPMEDDIIVLGDFNASTSQIGKVRWFATQTTAIPDQWMTNTRQTKNYDNQVFDGRATVEYTGRSGVFNFQQLYQITLDQALQVSDHFPIWGEYSIFENRGAQMAGGNSLPGSR